MFTVVYSQFGLRFNVKATNHAHACAIVMQLLGKRSIPWHVQISEA